MSVLEIVRIALQSLLGSKLRSGLTMLGIVIGVGAVIALVAAGAGAQAQVAERFQSLGSNLLVVTPRSRSFRGVSQGSGSGRLLTNDDVTAILSLARAVSGVAPEYAAQRQIAYGSNNARANVVGVTPAYKTVGNWRVESGRYISDLDIHTQTKVVVLGSSLAAELFGDSLVEPIGKTIKIDRLNYTIIGLLASKGVGGFQNLDGQAFIPLSTAQLRFGGAGNRTVQSINVQAASAQEIERATGELTAILRARHGLSGEQANDFTIRDQTQIVEVVQETAETFTVLLGSIAAISLIVGGIGIMNIMLVSVTERTREIGIRKAVGAERTHILAQFLTETVVLSVLGGLIGIGAGVAGAHVITPLLGGTRVLVTPGSVIMAVSVSIGVGLFFGLYPAYRAAGLSPMEALRYE